MSKLQTTKTGKTLVSILSSFDVSLNFWETDKLKIAKLQKESKKLNFHGSMLIIFDACAKSYMTRPTKIFSKSIIPTRIMILKHGHISYFRHLQKISLFLENKLKITQHFLQFSHHNF